MYIDKWIMSPLVEELYTSDYVDNDQMRYEKTLRERIARKDLVYPAMDGQVWQHYYSHANPFVDRSTFYSMLTYVAFDAKSMLYSPRQQKVHLVVWTYAAITLWVNGKESVKWDTPVYKPSCKITAEVSLSEGMNEITITLQNLGVRDTRTLFAIEIGDGDNLVSSYPKLPNDKAFTSCAALLDSAVLWDHTLVFAHDLMQGAAIGYDSQSPDYALVSSRVAWHDASGVSNWQCPDDVYAVKVRLDAEGETLTRSFEILSAMKSTFSDVRDVKGNFRRMLGVIADAEGLSRGDKFGFYIQNILARKALGRESEHDRDLFLMTLDQIESRYDCSDFLISGVIRYLKNYTVDAELKKRIDEVLINYRYWMTMDGADAMCFWSENHSLLFYSSALLVGAMYPDIWFPRAKMTGAELSAFGRRLAMEWFDDVEKYGFEEFLSTVYMNVTFACLLNIIDYGDEKLSSRATRATDRMLRMLSMHVFDGVIIAPMGRVYRGVIYPFRQGAQALMNLINPSVPTSFGEGWLSYYATSGYQIPLDAKALMEKTIDTSYSTGDALVSLKKEKDYCLTSVQSPRMDGFTRWPNLTLDATPCKDPLTHDYTKSFNERFHGTTFFQPGVYGYQQHMWSAALSSEALIFTNHPGSFCDDSSMRPGYWYGNGVMPAVRQQGSEIGIIYEIPDSHPIRFTHVFFPRCKFSEVIRDGEFLFARKDMGYAALWSSVHLVEHNDILFGAEFRAYGVRTAYYLAVGSQSEYGNFASFCASQTAKHPRFDEREHTLYVDDVAFLQFEKAEDSTQYV